MTGAAIYARISHTLDREKRKVDRQVADGQRQLAEAGIPVTEVYADPSRSAWKIDGERPEWNRLLLDTGAGRHGAIWIWLADRLARQPYDLEQLLFLARSRPLRLITSVREYNLADYDDLYELRGEINAACKESAKISTRTRRGMRDRRDSGLPSGNGRRVFGFTVGGGAVVEPEAAIIREVAGRIINVGEPGLRAICRDLTVRGVTTADGNPFSTRTLKRMLIRPAMIGRIVHNGTDYGPARHGAILDEQTWLALRSLFGEQAERASSRGPMPRHLLSGIAACASCERGLVSAHIQSRRSKSLRLVYRCINPECSRKVTRGMAALDNYVTDRVVALLAHLDLTAPPTDGPNFAAELDAVERRYREVEAALSGFDQSAAVLARTLARLDAQADEIRARMAAASADRTLDGVRGISRQRFDALPLDRRRAVVRELVVVRVMPAPKGPGFDPASVSVERRNG
jgi:site-specific DNA recombinase